MKTKLALIIGFGLLSAQNIRTLEIVPTVAAVATWAVVSPVVSLLANTRPNPLWAIGCLLAPNSLASRYAMGGIVGGTVGACAAFAVYNMFKSKKK